MPVFVGDVHVGSHPRGVAVWGDRAYVSLVDGGDVGVVDLNSRALQSRWDSPGGGANAIVADVTRVYMVHRDSRQVAVFDRATGALLALWPTDFLPWGAARLNDRLYVSNYGSDTVSVFDVNTGSLIRRVPVGDGPALLAVVNGGVYVPLINGDMMRLASDGLMHDVIRNVGTGTVAAIGDEARGLVYVSNRDLGFVAVVDENQRMAVAYIKVPGRPVALALSSNRRWLYAVDPFASTLHIVDTVHRRWAGQIPLEAQGGEQGGQGLAVAGDHLLVVNYDAGTLSLYDLPACASR